MNDSVSCWATSDFIKDPAHIDLLQEFFRAELLNPAAIDILPSLKGDGDLDIHFRTKHITHWSRRFEWPWAVLAADLKPTDRVLDAAGGNGLFQYVVARRVKEVVNVDLDPAQVKAASDCYLKSYGMPNVAFEEGDIRKLHHPDCSFDKVFCLSALEHIEDPEGCVRELSRVVKPGGLLVMTWDIAKTRRWNHTIDLPTTGRIVTSLDLTIPLMPPNTLCEASPEMNPGKNDADVIALVVFCVKWRKPSVL